MIEATVGIDAMSGLALLGQAAGIPQGGDYFNVAKIIAMIALVFPWFYAAPFVSKDAIHVRSPQGLWSGLVLGAGALGVLLWLLLPIYMLGMGIYVVLTISVLLAYLSYRNGRVPEEGRILLGEILAKAFKRTPKVEVKPIFRLKVFTHDGKLIPPPAAEQVSVQEVETYNLLQEFLYDALWRRVSEIDIVPLGQESRVRNIIDGMPVERPAMNSADSEALIQYLKPLMGANPEERRRPQKGKIAVDMASGQTEIEIVTAGTTGGQRMQFRVQHEIIQTKLDELGMSKEVIDRVRELSDKPGIILVSGRTGSGVTSTLYSLLREQDAFTQQIITFEKSFAAELPNITQSTYESDDKLVPAFASALRRDPDVIMLDHCPNAEVAEMMTEVCNEKKFILGTHASDTFVAMAKWIKVVGNAEKAMNDLQGILCQMLVRKLCPNCREAYRPDPSMLAKANLPVKEVETFYRVPSKPQVDEKGNPIICGTCQGNGYFGRTAVFEWLEVTDEVRKLAVSGASASQIKAACRKNRMLYLQEQALRKVIEGVTSIQEVIRVSQQAQAKTKES